MSSTGVYAYAATFPGDPFVPVNPPTIFTITTDSETSVQIAKLREEIENLRHTQEGMAGLIRSLLKTKKKRASGAK
jgi:hypothetical protein